MSRYTIPAKNSEHLVIVGWDNPTRTFFGQVHDRNVMDDDKETLIVWIGTNYDEVTDLQALQEGIAAYAEIPSYVMDCLARDKA